VFRHDDVYVLMYMHARANLNEIHALMSVPFVIDCRCITTNGRHRRLSHQAWDLSILIHLVFGMSRTILSRLLCYIQAKYNYCK